MRLQKAFDRFAFLKLFISIPKTPAVELSDTKSRILITHCTGDWCRQSEWVVELVENREGYSVATMASSWEGLDRRIARIVFCSHLVDDLEVGHEYEQLDPQHHHEVEHVHRRLPVRVRVRQHLHEHAENHGRDAADVGRHEPGGLGLQVVDEVAFGQVGDGQRQRHGDDEQVPHQVGLGVEQRRGALLAKRTEECAVAAREGVSGGVLVVHEHGHGGNMEECSKELDVGLRGSGAEGRCPEYRRTVW